MFSCVFCDFNIRLKDCKPFLREIQIKFPVREDLVKDKISYDITMVQLSMNLGLKSWGF